MSDRIKKALDAYKRGGPIVAAEPPADLEKSDKPPAGFQPIPGGKHGGYTNGKRGQQRRYWYAHDSDVDAAAAHHLAEARRIDRTSSKTRSGYPSNPEKKRAMEDHSHAGYAIRDGEYRTGRKPKKPKAAPAPAAESGHGGVTPADAKLLIENIDANERTSKVPSMLETKGILRAIVAGKSKAEAISAGAAAMKTAMGSDMTDAEAHASATTTYTSAIQHMKQMQPVKKALTTDERAANIAKGMSGNLTGLSPQAGGPNVGSFAKAVDSARKPAPADAPTDFHGAGHDPRWNQ